jgi:hypothetical protein
MAGPYYVDPSVGSSGAGTSWGTAYKTLKEATDVASTGEIVYMSNATADSISSTTTYTLNEGVMLISCAGATSTYAVGATVTASASGVTININGRGAMFGFKFSAGPLTSRIFLVNTDDDYIVAEDCTFDLQSSSTQFVALGFTTGARSNAIKTKNCKFTFGSTGQSINVCAKWQSVGDTFAGTGSVPTVLFGEIKYNQTDILIEGADFSNINTTLIVGNATCPAVFRLAGCKFNASVTLLGTTVTYASSEVYVYDSSWENSGLQGMLFYHQNHLGSTQISASIYANDGAKYDGTNYCSWVVDGTTGATFGRHYATPWIDVYNADVSTAITPYFECVRSGSATAYTDEQVWANFEYKGTANLGKLAFVTDRRGVNSSPADQDTSSLGSSDWTGESGTSWFGKLAATSSFTPAEAGYIRGRIEVSGDYTVYVDPQIRGLA